MNRWSRAITAISCSAVLTLPSTLSAQGMCWRVPAVEKNLSAYVKDIVTGGSATRQAGTFLPATAGTSVAVVTDTAQCRAIAAAHQRQEYTDSLASPHPVVVIRTGDPATPSTVRYVVWDNLRLGEWWAITVYDAALNRLGGWTW